jgi:DNA-directed RNA polymerase specialized sigma54-like protein
MIENRLTNIELEKIIQPILKLDAIEIIKKNIYNTLHFTRGKPAEKDQYIINANFTGINSTYKGFEIEILRLNDSKNGFADSIIKFRKRKTFIDYFINPKNRIVNALKVMCGKEIEKALFGKFDPRGIVKENVKEEFLYQLGTLNPDWKEQNKLSPLTMYTREDLNSYLIEFLFTPECYERKADKTTLKDDWLEIFRSTPAW